MSDDTTTVPTTLLQRFLSMLDSDEHKGDTADSVRWFMRTIGWPEPEWCYVHEHTMLPWEDQSWREEDGDEPCEGE